MPYLFACQCGLAICQLQAASFKFRLPRKSTQMKGEGLVDVCLESIEQLKKLEQKNHADCTTMLEQCPLPHVHLGSQAAV